MSLMHIHTTWQRLNGRPDLTTRRSASKTIHLYKNQLLTTDTPIYDIIYMPCDVFHYHSHGSTIWKTHNRNTKHGKVYEVCANIYIVNCFTGTKQLCQLISFTCIQNASHSLSVFFVWRCLCIYTYIFYVCVFECMAGIMHLRWLFLLIISIPAALNTLPISHLCACWYLFTYTDNLNQCEHQSKTSQCIRLVRSYYYHIR